MATYFHGAPEIQSVDGLQTLYLMNPSYVSYADSSSPPTSHHHHHHHHPNNNMVFLNSPLTSLTPPPQQPPQQHFVGIPLQNLQDSSSLQGYNLWGAAQNMNSIDFQMKRAATSSSAQQQQGLSLSLSQEVAAGGGGGEEVKMVGVMGSKYLKAAQELLDEVVSVGKGIGSGGIKEKRVKEGGKMAAKEEDGGGDGGGGGGGDLSTAERQELQMKKAKLVNMLDEVEHRYRQYHQQMQMVVSSFEAVAGFGSAKSYTALALQTISKQFRCLRDAISNQVRATSKSLGEEDCLPPPAGGSKSSVGSRLRFVDHHLRQQRALQQLGMMQHNAWRPQRGLPERAVSVLRAWLFEHFLHPYPKDSDKHMLAKQTGLTRSQVSNWFINARVRLWKPMVEEMYIEETKERELSNDNNNNNNNNTTKISKSETSDQSLSASRSPSHQPTTSSPSVADHHLKPVPDPKHSSPLASAVHPSSDFNMMFTDESLIQQRMKKPQTTSNENQIPNELSNRELLMKFMDQGGAFGGYPISEIARFDHHEQFPPRFGANGVSLTLGLPHCEYLSNESIQLEGSLEMNTAENNNYFNLNNTNGNNMNNSSGSHTPSGYESINIQNRKRFAAQLLPDYVA